MHAAKERAEMKRHAAVSTAAMDMFRQAGMGAG
jgi:hypothetical protein